MPRNNKDFSYELEHLTPEQQENLAEDLAAKAEIAEDK